MDEMKWLYKYLNERQDVLRTNEAHYKRWLARVNQHPADREAQELLAGEISRLAVSRDECDRIMRFITFWSRQNPTAGGEAVGGQPPADPPTASPPRGDEDPYDRLFQDGIRAALDWARRFRSDNIGGGEKDVQEVMDWLRQKKE